jgi:hypothetical protein
MALTQGTPLPNITTNQTQATTAPSWYTDYLSGLANTGNQAAAGAQYVGATPLQQQAFNQTTQNIGSYQPNLNAATNLAQQAGNYDVAQSAGNFMNPYTQQVVGALGDVGRRNIEQYLAPNATAAAVGSGQFGSKRGAEVLGQAMNQGLQNLNLAQSQALQTGYSQALQAAQQQEASKLAASQQFGNLANQTQSQNLADINALSTLGSQQQQIEQNASLFPMQVANQQAGLLRGYTVPTAVQSSYTGPIPGAYSASPLSQIAGIGSLLGALNTTPAGGGNTAAGNIIGGLGDFGSYLSKLFSTNGNSNPSLPIDPSTGQPVDLTQIVGGNTDPAQAYQDWLTGSGGMGNYGE